MKASSNASLISFNWSAAPDSAGCPWTFCLEISDSVFLSFMSDFTKVDKSVVPIFDHISRETYLCCSDTELTEGEAIQMINDFFVTRVRSGMEVQKAYEVPRRIILLRDQEGQAVSPSVETQPPTNSQLDLITDRLEKLLARHSGDLS